MTHASNLFSKRRRKAQSMSKAVNNVTEQPDTVSSHQRAGCSPVSCAIDVCMIHLQHRTGSCAFQVHDTPVCMRVADTAASVTISVATIRVSRSPFAAAACCCCCRCDTTWYLIMLLVLFLLLLQTSLLVWCC